MVKAKSCIILNLLTGMRQRQWIQNLAEKTAARNRRLVLHCFLVFDIIEMSRIPLL